MENPQTGTLKNRDVVKDLKYYDVDYCMYSDWGYRKRTRVWTNKENFNNKLCDGKGTCGNMITIPTDGAKRHDSDEPLKCEERLLHKNNCGRSGILRDLRNYRKKYKEDVSITIGGGTNIIERYRIPPQLIRDLFS